MLVQPLHERNSADRLAPAFSLVLFFAFASLGWVSTPPPAAAQSESAASFAEALRSGKAKVSVRYRFEAVDEDRFDRDAEASTVRTALSYGTGEWKGWSLFLEAENVAAVFDDDDYNNAGAGSLNNGVRGVPVVADPKLTEMNQAYLRYRNESLRLTLGRQEIGLGDQRFVGAVAWRQNHQSFDAARLQWDAGEAVDVDYSYLGKVHRIFGDTLDLDGHLLYVPMNFGGGHRLTAYGFWLDYEEAGILSTATYGLEYAAALELSDRFTLKLELEAAQQDDHGDNPLAIDTEYFLASVGGDTGPVGFDVAWEVLGEQGSGGRAFQTPLATLHKFNGWADKFLQTPGPGLETLYLRLKGKIGKPWKWAVIYHDFSSDGGDLDYGTEIDGELVYTARWKQKFALRYASYDADDFATDTEKIMLWSSYTF